MSNITFTIVENKVYDENNITESHIYEKDNNNFKKNEENKCNEVDYIEYVNYTTKQLNYILQYYNISKGKMCKDEMIQTIILFETDISNVAIVNKRKYMWNIIKQIKSDDYLYKYLIIDIK